LLWGGVEGVLDVIIVDEFVSSSVISDTITFTGVTKGNIYETNVNEVGCEGQNLNNDPFPFVLRNDGTEDVDVWVYATSNLFSLKHNLFGGSSLKFKIIEPDDTNMQCATVAIQGFINECNEVEDPEEVPPEPNECYVSAPQGSEFSYLPTLESNKVKAIDNLHFHPLHRMAIMHIQIDVHNTEPSGPKDTTVVIVGTAA